MNKRTTESTNKWIDEWNGTYYTIPSTLEILNFVAASKCLLND